jgi:hypothetical protein
MVRATGMLCCANATHFQRKTTMLKFKSSRQLLQNRCTLSLELGCDERAHYVHVTLSRHHRDGLYQSPIQSYRSLLCQIHVPLQLAHVKILDVNYLIIFQRSIQFKVVVLYMLIAFLLEETRIMIGISRQLSKTCALCFVD